MALFHLTDMQLDKMDNCCEQLGIAPGFMPEGTFCGNLDEMLRQCKYLEDDLSNLVDSTETVYATGRYPIVDDTISAMEDMVAKLNELLTNMGNMLHAAQNAVMVYKDLSQCGEYELTLTEEEILHIIHEHLAPETCMAVSYKDGEFFLVFSDNVEEGATINTAYTQSFATGRVEAWSRVEDYILSITKVPCADET